MQRGKRLLLDTLRCPLRDALAWSIELLTDPERVMHIAVVHEQTGNSRRVIGGVRQHRNLGGTAVQRR